MGMEKVVDNCLNHLELCIHKWEESIILPGMTSIYIQVTGQLKRKVWTKDQEKLPDYKDYQLAVPSSEEVTEALPSRDIYS